MRIFSTLLQALIFTSVLFPLSSLATSAQESEYRDYMIPNELGAISARLPKSMMEEAQNTLTQIAQNIAVCREYLREHKNPLIDKVSVFSVQRSTLGCRVGITAAGTRRYSCLLSKSEQLKFASAMQMRAKGAGAMGDFSASEKEILFDPEVCEEQRL